MNGNDHRGPGAAQGSHAHQLGQLQAGLARLNPSGAGTGRDRARGTSVPVAARTVVGRDLLPGGQFLRIVAGLVLLAAVVQTAHHRGLGAGSVFEQLIPAFLIVTISYAIVVRMLGERVLARIDGWLAAFILVAPAAALSALPFVPVAVSAGVTLYLAIGMLVQAVIGYGGCEVAGIPTLILHRRYRIYCAFSGADLVERQLQGRPAWIRWTAMLLAVLATAGLFVLVAALTPTWFQNYGEYLLFLATGYAINWIVTTTATRRKSRPGRLPAPSEEPSQTC